MKRKYCFNAKLLTKKMLIHTKNCQTEFTLCTYHVNYNRQASKSLTFQYCYLVEVNP